MSHNEAWQFIRLGTLLERADKTTRILDVKYFILLPSVSDVGTPYDDVQWSAVLNPSAASRCTASGTGASRPNASWSSCCWTTSSRAPSATASAWPTAPCTSSPACPVGSFSCPSEQRMGVLRSGLDFTAVDAILAGGLHEFCDAVQTKMNTIDECISGDFFAQRPLAADGAGLNG